MCVCVWMCWLHHIPTPITVVYPNPSLSSRAHFHVLHYILISYSHTNILILPHPHAPTSSHILTHPHPHTPTPSHTVVVEEGMTVNMVCHLLVVKNHFDESPNWVLVEQLGDVSLGNTYCVSRSSKLFVMLH